MVDEVQQFSQIQALYAAILPKLSPEEKTTFTIRPAVTHGDIEIFLNGRLYSASMKNVAVVMQQNQMDDFVEGFLKRLRGGHFPWSAQKHEYTLHDVQREINFFLVNFANDLLPEDKDAEIDDAIDHELCKVFNLVEPPKQYTTAHYQFINNFMVKELIRYVGEIKNGRRK